jgi:hypothetical protein
LTEATSSVDTLSTAQGDGSAVGASEGTFTGFDIVTGFVVAKDLFGIDGDAAQEVFASDAATTAGNDLSTADFADVDSVVSFIADIVTNETSVMDTAAITTLAITFDDFTAVYLVDNDDTTAPTAGEIELLATVDAVLTTTEIA